MNASLLNLLTRPIVELTLSRPPQETLPLRNRLNTPLNPLQNPVVRRGPLLQCKRTGLLMVVWKREFRWLLKQPKTVELQFEEMVNVLPVNYPWLLTEALVFPLPSNRTNGRHRVPDVITIILPKPPVVVWTRETLFTLTPLTTVRLLVLEVIALLNGHRLITIKLTLGTLHRVTRVRLFLPL